MKNKENDMTIHEASDFWDEHEFDEFKDIIQIKNIQFNLKKKKYIGIDKDLFDTIKNKADILNISEDTLINKWLSEKVRL